MTRRAFSTATAADSRKSRTCCNRRSEAVALNEKSTLIPLIAPRHDFSASAKQWRRRYAFEMAPSRFGSDTCRRFPLDFIASQFETLSGSIGSESLLEARTAIFALASASSSRRRASTSCRRRSCMSCRDWFSTEALLRSRNRATGTPVTIPRSVATQLPTAPSQYCVSDLRYTEYAIAPRPSATGTSH